MQKHRSRQVYTAVHCLLSQCFLAPMQTPVRSTNATLHGYCLLESNLSSQAAVEKKISERTRYGVVDGNLSGGVVS